MTKRRRNTGLHAAGLERPHVWKIGPDANRHKMYIPFLKARAQANYRNEGWDLTFEKWFELWDGQWERRGRGIDDLCITRIDPEKPWSDTNAQVVARIDHLREQNLARKGKSYRSRKGKL
jgi:hypothetical protein